MRLITWKATNKQKEQVCSGSYCYLNYALDNIQSQIAYDLQKKGIELNDILITFVNPVTNKETVIAM